MRLNDLPEPNKTILHGVERLLKESGRNSLNQSTSLCPRSVSPRRVLHGYSARMGSTHARSGHVHPPLNLLPFTRTRTPPSHHITINVHVNGKGWAVVMTRLTAFSDSEPLAPERANGPMQHTEVGHARSSLRTAVPICSSPPSLLTTASCSSGHQQLPVRDTRRY
ncbi:hypothetical protein TSMEX_005329 [Taenia solium]|eukprot:TsM_000659800 transcript=TsM_000659800 gene=TsM_000659800